MSILLMPLFLISKSIRFGNNNPWMSMFFFPVLIILMIRIKNKPDNMIIQKNEFQTLFLVFSLLFVSQLMGLIVDYFRGELSLAGGACTLLHFIIFLCGALSFALIVKGFVQTRADMVNFIRGGQCALIALLVLCLMQLLYIKTGFFKGSVNFIAQLLEERPGAGNASWYREGSYVTTNSRINGLKQEPGYLAAQLAIVFAPFLLASIKTKISGFTLQYSTKNKWFSWITLLLMLVIMFLSGSTTSILAVIVIVGILLRICMKTIRSLIISVVSIVLLVSLLASFSSAFSDILTSVVIQKFSLTNLSFAQRAGSTLALFKTWLHDFLFGVGYMNTASYGPMYAPNFMKHNMEYLYNWPVIQGGIFPILSILLGMLAQFGLVGVGTVIIWVRSNYLKMSEVRTISENISMESYVFFVFKYFLIIFLVLSLFSFDWYSSEYLVMFFFLNRAGKVFQVSSAYLDN